MWIYQFDLIYAAVIYGQDNQLQEGNQGNMYDTALPLKWLEVSVHKGNSQLVNVMRVIGWK